MMNPNDSTSGIMTTGGIARFRFWCQKVLPLVYDDSLSYYEVLCKLVDFLNKMVDSLNEALVEVDNYEKNAYAYTDKQIAKNNVILQSQINAKIAEEMEEVKANLQKAIDKYNAELEAYKIYNDDRVDSIDSKLNNIVPEVEQIRDNLIDYVNNAVKGMNDSVHLLSDNFTLQMEQHRRQVELEMAELMGQVKDLLAHSSITMLDPTTGRTDYINNVVNHVYDYSRVHGAFAIQYDTWGKTCAWWDEFGATARGLDTVADQIVPHNQTMFTRNPFTGNIDTVRRTFTFVVQQYSTAQTALQRDRNENTAEYIDNENQTAKNIDFPTSSVVPETPEDKVKDIELRIGVILDSISAEQVDTYNGMPYTLINGTSFTDKAKDCQTKLKALEQVLDVSQISTLSGEIYDDIDVDTTSANDVINHLDSRTARIEEVLAVSQVVH